MVTTYKNNLKQIVKIVSEQVDTDILISIYVDSDFIRQYKVDNQTEKIFHKNYRKLIKNQLNSKFIKSKSTNFKNIINNTTKKQQELKTFFGKKFKNNTIKINIKKLIEPMSLILIEQYGESSIFFSEFFSVYVAASKYNSPIVFYSLDNLININPLFDDFITRFINLAKANFIQATNLTEKERDHFINIFFPKEK